MNVCAQSARARVFDMLPGLLNGGCVSNCNTIHIHCINVILFKSIVVGTQNFFVI